MTTRTPGKEELCGCCEGVQILTPLTVANRPGLDALYYRVGRHNSFLETMKARLSAAEFEALRGLTSREAQDPAIAWLDAWATVAEVLTFYQERIANEGFLRTAVERLSVQELAYLVGYRLRPGVAASVYLAFTLDKGYEVLIPAGTRAQSLPGPGETAQPFETSEPLQACDQWNLLQQRLSQVQYLTKEMLTPPGSDPPLPMPYIYLSGVGTKLSPNDPVLVLFNTQNSPVKPNRYLYRVLSVTPNPAAGRTQITAQPWECDVPEEKAPAPRSLQQLDAVYCGEAIADEAKRFGVYCLDGGLCWDTAAKLNALWAPVDAMLSEQPNLRAAILGQAGDLEALLRDALDAVEASNPDLAEEIGDQIAQLGSLQGMNTSESPIPYEMLGKFLIQTRTVLQALAGVPDVDQPRLDLALPIVNNALNMLGALAPQVAALIAGVQVLYAEIDPQVRPVRAWLRSLQTELGAAAQDLELPFFGDIGIPIPGVINFLVNPPAGAEPAEAASQPGAIETLGADQAQGFVGELFFDPTSLFAFGSDSAVSLLGAVSPDSARLLYKALETQIVQTLPKGEPVLSGVAAMRVQAPLFGHNAPDQPVLDPATGAVTSITRPTLRNVWGASIVSDLTLLALDAVYDKIKPGTYIFVGRPAIVPTAHLVTKAEPISLGALGVSVRVTLLTLGDAWITAADLDNTDLLRQTTVYAQAETLDPAEEPITAPIEGKVIELDRVYRGLPPGRWLIVAGEQLDRSGVFDGELVKLDTVVHSVQKVDTAIDLPGERPHTFLHLGGSGLAHLYKADTVKIYGNIVVATHGETRQEVLGSGDGAQALQAFALGRSPLTYVAAPTAAGADSTLQVRVNSILWHEAENLAGLIPTDRQFITFIDDDDKVTITFGDGEHGARLPTGDENISATYRRGIGRTGNVAAGRISLLSTKPLGVKGVVNPLAASGGADRESRDRARRNAPLGVTALDRLVSVQDYADFVRTFAGIGKSSAVRLSDGQRQVVHVTIAGADDIPIDKTSELYRNLILALQSHGEPYQAFRVDKRDLMLLIIWARVKVLPDYVWKSTSPQVVGVEPQVRAALLDAFSFERRELGQDVLYAEAVSTIQAVRGVDYCDVDILDAVEEDRLLQFLQTGIDPQAPAVPGSDQDEDDVDLDDLQVARNLSLKLNKRIRCKLAENTGERPLRIAPAQLAFLSPDVPHTLVLEEIQA